MITSLPPVLTTPSGPATPLLDERQVAAQVEVERLSTLYALVTLPMWVAAGFTLVVVQMTAGAVPPALLYGWAASKLLVIALRLADAYHFRCQADAALAPARQRHWQRRYLVLNLVDAVGWGLLTPLLLPHLEQQLILALTVVTVPVAVSSMGVFIGFSHLHASLGYTLGALTPPAVYFLLGDGSQSKLAGLSLMIFQGVLSHECWRGERRLSELLRLRYESAAVAELRRHALGLAEHSNQAKTRFLAAVSHEMRTPLNGILGLTQLLHADVQVPEQRERLAVVQDSARHLQTVIGDLLDLSRIEFGRLDIAQAPYAPGALARQVADLLQPVAAGKGLVFRLVLEPDLPACVQGDAARLRQVLLNLLGNAIKFTSDGEVTLSVAHRPPMLAFTVSDTGPGIAPEDAQRIFAPFAQAGSQTQRRAGVGLGLTISRELARAMGGDVVFEAVPDGRPRRGSVFKCTVTAPPAAPIEAQDLAAAAEPPPLCFPGKVLVADDNPVNLMVATAMLAQFGVAFDSAEDGVQALHLLSQGRRYDLVLMDCEMPNLDGLEATRRWRQQEQATAERRPQIIVAMTANAIAGDRERCLAAGMDDYLAKPFELDDLRRLLQRHLTSAPTPVEAAAQPG